MTKRPEPNEIYRHFKGNLYKIITLAAHSETGETLVIYQALYGNYQVYARNLSMFMSKVDREKYPDVLQEDRFLLIPQNVGKLERPETGEEIKTVSEPGAVEKTETFVEPKTFAESQPLTIPEQSNETETQDSPLDPMLLEFLDADSYEEKLNLLVGMHARLTDDMVNTMAVSMDVEVADGNLEDRYVELKNCLLTLEKYECKRLR